MGRKSLADRIRESGSATQRELDESTRAMARLSGTAQTDTGQAPAGTLVEDDGRKEDSKAETRYGREIYQAACRYYEGLLEDVAANRALDLALGFDHLAAMVDAMARDEALFSVSLHSNNGLEFLTHHGVNVAVQAAKLAAALGMTAPEQVEAGAVGLFHDLGKALLPKDLLYKAGKLSDSQLGKIRESVDRTHDLLQPFSGTYPYLAEAASQVYERIDGTGYPRGLKGGEIHRYAQIVGLADIYEALTHGRPQRAKYMHFVAVKQILTGHKKSFDRTLLKAFLDHFTLFPIESFVRLNSGAVGKVLSTYKEHPLKPEVRIIMDSHGNHVWSGQKMDLSREPLLYIVDAVPGPDQDQEAV